jgi:hypothetical protein
MAREGEKVTIHVLDIHGHVGHRLGSIDKDSTTILVGFADILTNWINGPQNIRHVSHSDEFDST